MKKDRFILGIQSFANMDSGASIVRADTSGKVLDFVAISEERLLRKKHPYTFPLHSIDYCMKYFELKKISQIDYLISDWIRLKRWEISGPTFNISEFDYLKNIFNFPKKKIKIISHHLAHAASTYYTSGFKNSAILIVDGNGSDLETTSYFNANGFNINFMENYKHFGLGALYNIISTRMLNMGTGGEGKTMGLAPYGEKFRKKGIKIEFYTKGIINDFANFMQRMPYSDVLNQIDNKYRVDPIKVPYKKIKNNEDVLKPYFSGSAYNLQQLTEKVLINLSKDLYSKTNSKNLCIAGGVGLNSVANKKIFDNTKFKDIFIFPACSDSGIPFGLAIWGYYNLPELKIKKYKKLKFKNAYFGNKYDNTEILRILKKYNIKYSKCNLKTVAKLISEKNIVGWFQGRSEYGPRALGNRSILADSRHKNMKNILNDRVKHRENYRPFAPSILEEESSKYFDLKIPSPFMLLIAKVKKKNVPAITHVDDTARVQTINKTTNLKFYNLIQEFKKLTGVPCVLNTSFNDAGDPIVETPEDALETLLKCDMDYLYIGGYLVKRKENLREKHLSKNISSNIKKRINNNRKIILKKYFKKYSIVECNKFIKKNNLNSLRNLLLNARDKLNINIQKWIEQNQKILVIGDKDHTKFLINNFKKFKYLNVVEKIFLKGKKININQFNKIFLKKLKNIDFDTILISSFQYNFYFENFCKKNMFKYYKIYNSTDRNLMDIYKNRYIEKLMKGKL